MSSTPSKSTPALGFLTVVEHPQLGLMGGYLLLTPTGRPLEFHCTTPLKPNRAQQILYGPTLEPYLYGEQIGHTLLAKAATAARLVCTDLAPVLAVRPLVAMPVTLVVGGSEKQGQRTQEGKQGAGSSAVAAAADGNSWRADPPQSALRQPAWPTFEASGATLMVDPAHAGDKGLVVSVLESLGTTVELTEPFGRIRAAIEEAQRSAR